MLRAFDKRTFVRDHKNRTERRFEESAYPLGQAVMAVRQQDATRRCIVHCEHAPLWRTSRRANSQVSAMHQLCPVQSGAVTSQNYEGDDREITRAHGRRLLTHAR